MAIDRGRFLTGCAAVGAAAFVRHVHPAAQGRPAGARLFRIDTHSHFTTPKLYELATARGVNQATLQDWTPAKSLQQQMEEGTLRPPSLSISDPGVHFGDDNAARALAREGNEQAARVIQDHPGRSGLFAVLPLPDVEGALPKRSMRATR